MICGLRESSKKMSDSDIGDCVGICQVEKGHYRNRVQEGPRLNKHTVSKGERWS